MSRSTDAGVQLERASRELDRLIRDVRSGARSHREHERNVDRGERIAAEIRAAFRGAAVAPVSHAPIKVGTDGAWF